MFQQNDENRIPPYTIITTEPNATVKNVHDRMPLVLLPGEWDTWLHGDYKILAERIDVPLDKTAV